jgi:5-methylcytosine-specific restriction endonuclease McrA
MNTKVLTLNKFFQPLKVVSAYHALKAVINERAEIVCVENGNYICYNIDEWFELSMIKHQFEEEKTGLEDWIKTPDYPIEAPKIIRFLNFKKVPVRNNVRFSRRNIFIRDNYTCQYCGGKPKTSELELEHIIPKSRGGKSVWENTVCACSFCNDEKRDRTPEEAGMKLLRKPFKPNFLQAYGPPKVLQDNKYDDWQHFIDEVYWNIELK